jgi:hypothetical protein
VKVWGPKKNDSLQPVRSSVEDLRPLLPAQLSIIVDSNLSDQDHWYLRNLHRAFWNIGGKVGCVRVVFKHLFNEYGFTFPDKTLLYAALAYSRKSVWMDSRADVIYWEYISRFQKSLLSAIQKETISECQLFAIFLVLLSRSRDERDFEIFHKQGFATILRRLVAANETPNAVIQGAPKLSFLWHYLLTFLCRAELATLCRDGRNLVWELHDAVEELRLPARLPDSRLTKDFPPLLWEENLICSDWLSLVRSLLNDKAILRVCVERVNAEEPRTWSKVAQSTTLVKRRLVAMSNLPSVQNLLYRVRLQLTTVK